jgi:hypothetical protein
MRKNISVPFKDRELAKRCGAKWDPIERTWYIDRGKTQAVQLGVADLKKWENWCRAADVAPIVEFKPTKWCPAWRRE